MNNSQLVNLFKESTKNYSSNWGSEALIAEWLDEGQIDIILRTGCYSSSKNLTSVASQREYSLGSDVLRVNHVLFNNLEVQPTTMEKAQLHGGYPTETAATPSHFYIRMEDAPYLCFTPPPSTGSLTIAVHYLKRPPTLTSTDNDPVIPEQYHRLIVQHAMYNVLVKDAKMETASKWLEQYERRVTRMIAEINGFAKQRRKGFVPYGNEHQQKDMKSFSGDV